MRLEYYLPSRPGELRPEPLTGPDVSLSTYPARTTAEDRRLPPRPAGPARRFGLQLKVLLRKGLTLWHARDALDDTEFDLRSQQSNREMTAHLRDRILKDDDN